MSGNNFESGHPRTRGARSNSQNELNLGGKYPIRSGSVPSFDGTPIFFCEEGIGPPLVFCYGIACSTLHWTYQIDYFRKNYRCIWFDYRGHQHTPLPKSFENMTVEACAKDLKAVLDFLEVKETIVLGHSMGVSVVLQFTKMFPERVNRLILANGTAKRPLDSLFGGNFLVAAFNLLSKFEKKNPEVTRTLWKLQEKASFIPQFLGLVGFNRSLTAAEDIQTYAKQIAQLPPSVLTYMLDDYQNFDASPWLHEIQQKTLILSGEDDQVTPPRTQDLMAQLMPNAELVRIHRGSHCSTLDMPDYVNLLIEKFIEKEYLSPGGGVG